MKIESRANADKFRLYDWLVGLWYKKHHRVNHWKMSLQKENNI